jgi:hypothetical protein
MLRRRSNLATMNPSPADSSGLLVGNSFPLSLIRRRVVIEPTTVDALRAALAGKTLHSFWGHANTLAAASRHLGVDLTPTGSRRALVCDPASALPSLDQLVFSECWIVSPEYAAGFRPALGAEVPPATITGWQVLRMQWSDQL